MSYWRRGLLDPLVVLLRLELLQPHHVDLAALDQLDGPLHPQRAVGVPLLGAARRGVVVAEDVERAHPERRRAGDRADHGDRAGAHLAVLVGLLVACRRPRARCRRAASPRTRAATDQRAQAGLRTTVGKPVMMVFLRGSTVCRASSVPRLDAKCTTAPLRHNFHKLRSERPGTSLPSLFLTERNPRRLAAVRSRVSTGTLTMTAHSAA